MNDLFSGDVLNLFVEVLVVLSKLTFDVILYVFNSDSDLRCCCFAFLFALLLVSFVVVLLL